MGQCSVGKRERNDTNMMCWLRPPSLSAWLLHTRRSQTPLSAPGTSLMSLLSPHIRQSGGEIYSNASLGLIAGQSEENPSEEKKSHRQRLFV